MMFLMVYPISILATYKEGSFDQTVSKHTALLVRAVDQDEAFKIGTRKARKLFSSPNCELSVTVGDGLKIEF